MLVLKAGATPFRTARQWSSVCPVSRFVPPRNCMDARRQRRPVASSHATHFTIHGQGALLCMRVAVYSTAEDGCNRCERVLSGAECRQTHHIQCDTYLVFRRGVHMLSQTRNMCMRRRPCITWNLLSGRLKEPRELTGSRKE